MAQGGTTRGCWRSAPWVTFLCLAALLATYSLWAWVPNYRADAEGYWVWVHARNWSLFGPWHLYGLADGTSGGSSSPYLHNGLLPPRLLPAILMALGIIDYPWVNALGNLLPIALACWGCWRLFGGGGLGAFALACFALDLAGQVPWLANLMRSWNAALAFAGLALVVRGGPWPVLIGLWGLIWQYEIVFALFLSVAVAVYGLIAPHRAELWPRVLLVGLGSVLGLGIFVVQVRLQLGSFEAIADLARTVIAARDGRALYGADTDFSTLIAYYIDPRYRYLTPPDGWQSWRHLAAKTIATWGWGLTVTALIGCALWRRQAVAARLACALTAGLLVTPLILRGQFHLIAVHHATPFIAFALLAGWVAVIGSLPRRLAVLGAIGVVVGLTGIGALDLSRRDLPFDGRLWRAIVALPRGTDIAARSVESFEPFLAEAVGRPTRTLSDPPPAGADAAVCFRSRRNENGCADSLRAALAAGWRLEIETPAGFLARRP